MKYEVAVPPRIGGLWLAPESQARLGETGPLAVDVIYTTEKGTQRALEKARALAQELRAHIRLVFIYAVPYTLPLTKPAVPLLFLEDKLGKLASGFSGEASVQIFLCRETLQTLEDVLPQASLVVLGGRRRWWPTKAQRLERRLQKLGHQVIFTEAR